MSEQRRSVVARFEDFLQGTFEGVFGKVFRTRLQPVELSRKLERAMDENLTISAGRRVASNAYQLSIGQSDYARFDSFMPSLIKQLQDRLILIARQRNYTLTAKPVVKIVVDPQLGTGEARVTAHLFDAAQLSAFAGPRQTGSLAPGAPAEAAPETTYPVAPGSAPAAPAIPYAALVLRTAQGPGQSHVLNRDVIHIGRHTSNDIVINDRRVSRFHAEIRFEHGQFILYDLGSLNGVSINGAMTRQATLRNGDILALGNYSFVFERR